MASRSINAAVVCTLLAACGAGRVIAQEPSGPPPPSGTRSSGGPEVLELLPDIGRIGAQVAVFAGPSWNPYSVGQGLELGGYINLPLRRLPGGKLSYEIFLGLSLATSDAFDLAVPAGGAGLPGPPTTQSVRTKLRLLHVSPFALKYTLTRWDGSRLRPYLGAGADVLVVITAQERAEGGALVPQPPELEARGIPTGQGNIELAAHAAAGLELRMSAGLSLNIEYRFTTTTQTQGQLHGASAALGFHW
jgi:opacity protein-like surface antigen